MCPRPALRARLRSPMRKLAGLWVLGSLVAAVPPVATAGPTPRVHPPADPAEADYEKHMDNGVRLYQSGNFGGALVEFDAAYKAEPKASPLINEGLCYRDQHKYPEAVRVLEKALREHADTMDKKNKQAAEKAITEMRSLFAFLTLTVEPAEASVSVDGDAIARPLPDAIPLGPDAHRIVVEAPGYVSHTEKVTLASGDKRAIAIKLDSSMGSIHVTARKPDTSIELDGKVVGVGEWSGPVSAGGHSVRLVGESDTEPVDVAVGGTTTIDKRTSLDAPHGLPPIPVAPKAKPPPPPPPRGFYTVITGALLFTPAAPCAFLADPSHCLTGNLKNISRNAGGAGGLRMGYRVNTFAAFEGAFEYGNITGGVSGGQEGYSLTDLRVGPFLRLMSPGKLVHFVGTLGGGLAFDFVKFNNVDAYAPCLRGSAHQCFKSWGVDFYVATDVGIEFDFDGVLLGASFNLTGNALKGVDANPSSGTTGPVTNQFDHNAALFLGPRVHFGYAFW